MNLSFSLTVHVMQHNNEVILFLESHSYIFHKNLYDSQNIGQTFRRISIANITSENIQPIVQHKTHRAFVAT